MRTMRTVPMALMAAPVVGSASTDPSAMASSTRPSCPLVRSKLERTSGMRETQLAKTSPLRKNVSPTALRAAVRVGTVLLLGYTGETFRSNRFDAIVRNVSGPTRTPTMVDVAAAAGVSLSTASLAFSGNKPVSEETRDRVLAAAGALGYAGPNPLARNLRRGRSGVVGVAVGRLSTAFRDPAALPMLDAVSEVLDAAGLGLLLMPDGDEHAGLPLDAVIYDICGCETWGPYDDLVARGVPLVVVEGPAWPGATYVDVEHRRGAAEVARHLHDLGHRRVATLTLDPSHPQREREAGLRDVYPDAEVIGPCASDLEAAQRAVGAWWDGGGEATAVVCQSDVQAAGVVLEARRRGMAVPDDLSVAGFDGVATPWLDLELTTVVQPLAEKGRATARAVLSRIAGEVVDDVLLPVRMRVGGSTGPVPPPA